MNNRDAEKEIEKIFSELKLQMSFPWNYDPQGLLSSIRVKCKLPPFIHESNPDIEKFANQTEWAANTLVDATSNEQPMGKIDTTLAMVTSKYPESSNKRGRDEGAYIAETTIDTKFKIIYNKRLRFGSIGKEKVIEVEDVNELEVSNDEATEIIKETLTEIEREQAATKESKTQMIEQ